MPRKRRLSSQGQRLASFLAEAGVASRRKAEALISSNQVTVNGKVITDPAAKVFPDRDIVTAMGELACLPSGKHYYILHKPKGYLSACGDTRGKPTVMDLLPGEERRLFPVGRLDFNAEGLLLLTDDGQISYRLTHPRFQIPRIYLVKVKGQPEQKRLQRLTRGVRVEGERLRAQSVKLIRHTRTNAWFEVTMTEGRYREIRRLFGAIRHLVIRIIRIAYGPLKLEQLAVGESRKLTRKEIKALKEYCDQYGKKS